MQNEDEFYAEKSRLLAEKEAAEKHTVELQLQTQELALDTQLWAAYSDAGGIGSDADREAYEAIKRYLKDGKMQFENGQPVFITDGLVELGSNGPKTAAEKIAELKQHSTFKHFFSGDAGNQADQQTGPKTFKREDAQAGKISIEDIALGKIQLEGTQSSIRPDAKVVDADKVANLKKRRWK